MTIVLKNKPGALYYYDADLDTWRKYERKTKYTVYGKYIHPPTGTTGFEILAPSGRMQSVSSEFWKITK